MSGSSFKVSRRDLEQEYTKYLNEKADAITSLYRQWGEVLVHQLRLQLPGLLFRNLKTRLNYRVYAPKTSNGAVKYITLSVGLITTKDKNAVPYIKYILNGSSRHFVPVKTRSGKETGILQWAKDYGMVRLSSKGEWIWQDGRVFRGMTVKGFQPNDYFQEVYYQYKNSIDRSVMKILNG